MKKVAYFGILAVLLAVFSYSSYRIIHYFVEKNHSEQATEELMQYADIIEQEGEPDRIEVDFDALRETNSDIVAWIYGADTGLNYPIVRGTDNDYYLHHLIDGSSNSNGTLFMDYQCEPDFSMQNTLIYGHNMRSGNMFGHLVEYKNSAFYTEHPYLYIITPDCTYRMDLLAGCVLNFDAPIYGFELSADYVRSCMENSTFQSQTTYSEEYPLLTLSTCSYEYEDARYAVIGQLVAVD